MVREIYNKYTKIINNKIYYILLILILQQQQLLLTVHVGVLLVVPGEGRPSQHSIRRHRNQIHVQGIRARDAIGLQLGLSSVAHIHVRIEVVAVDEVDAVEEKVPAVRAIGGVQSLNLSINVIGGEELAVAVGAVIAVDDVDMDRDGESYVSTALEVESGD